MTTTSFSLAPLFRHSIGFDRFNDLFERAFEGDASTSYPPYNIEKHGENEYRIVLAVAGFTEQDLSISLESGVLSVSGAKPSNTEEAKTIGYMHQGIAQRSFKLSYRLEDHIEVHGAKLENGLLTIDLLRVVPEAEKPRQIPIDSASGSQPQMRQLEASKGETTFESA
ncbi:Hsp20 family protein [Halomonas sp. McH1-25]|uniref:Hsp20 family protein n=1 Tax=unclassified Halomonas TaxID=2609666 RepID=UPI001EF41331|nr:MULTISPECIES: Hsp20 family protein [unclassified Halomonas]MCG7600381.1 Hsp20 family protein [Halomonas sp. McH1-25]MCP1344003.1 Hsp20 family protein [Halomonas sp. FL8]MCP1361507.1 Hsp20 family protein [Halomonas sp. BBD45]MCP1367570.1 Hsp20 family protein [Halomonas sp. BBD48]